MKGRILAVDVGTRRVGLAISDASRTLARPLETIAVTSDADAVERVARRIEQLDGEDDGIAAVVVGNADEPRRYADAADRACAMRSSRG